MNFTRFKILTLSCVFAGSLASLNAATSLEEAIKDVEISGVMRYRYDTGRFENRNKLGFRDMGNGQFAGRGIVSSSQAHRMLANFGLKASIGEDIKVFSQLRYGPTRDGGYGAGSSANTSRSFALRQVYAEYDKEQLNIKAGRQQMDSIWTENYYDGLVGMGVKATYKVLENTSLQAYIYDSFGVDEQGGIGGDLGGYYQGSSWSNLPFYIYNLYGVAASNHYTLGVNQLNSELWFSYLDQSAFLYALNVNFKGKFSDEVSFNVEASYLGNSLKKQFKRSLRADAIQSDNGNFFGAKGSIYAYGFDASLGALYYGKKDKYTFTVLEDTGNLNIIGGQEIIYTDGSHLTGDRGENSFVFTGLGYTIDKLRIGGDIAYGATKTGVAGLGGEKLELVGKVSYKLTSKLNLLAWYSYINIDTNNPSDNKSVDSKKNTTRLQAIYKF